MSSIKEVRKVLNDAGSAVDEAIQLIDKISVEKSGNEIFNKHIDGIRSTINKIYIDLAIVNTKTLRASKFEPSHQNITSE
jgi:uncharacterized protein (UPF0218 family)